MTIDRLPLLEIAEGVRVLFQTPVGDVVQRRRLKRAIKDLH